jgi:hypothetical protein
VDTGQWLAFFALPAFAAGAWVLQRWRGEALVKRMQLLPAIKRLGLTIRRPRISGFFPTVHWPAHENATVTLRFRKVRHGYQAELQVANERLRRGPRLKLDGRLCFLLPAMLGWRELGHLSQQTLPLVWRWRGRDPRAARAVDHLGVQEGLRELEDLSGMAGVEIRAARQLGVAIRARMDDEQWLDRMLQGLDRFWRTWLNHVC